MRVFLLLFAATFLHAAPTENLVILGGGPAGLSAAIFAGQANLSPLLVSCDDCSGGFQSIQWIENFPGFPEGIRGEELEEKIRLQASQFGARFQEGRVVAADLSRYPYKLTLEDGSAIYTQSLILSNGSQKRWLGLDSESALKGKGVFARSLDAPAARNPAVLGGGDAALEEALHLAETSDSVALIHRGPKLNASSYLQERVLSHPKITLLFDTVVEEILDPAQNCVTALALRNEKTQAKQLLPCDAVIVSIGSRPNTDLFQGQLELTPLGHIKIASPSSKTSIPGVFAAGDIADSFYRKAAAAVGAGCVAALDAKTFLNAHQLVRLPVGELQEKWQYPSDHLPIGVSIKDGKDSYSLISWNVLNSAYLHWIAENGQGLARSAIMQENIPVKENGLTLREQHTIDLILEMLQHAKILCLQECSELFLQELSSQLPPHIRIARSSDHPVKNQNAVLYDSLFRLIEKRLHQSPFPSEPGRPLQEVLLEKEGVVYQIYNVHLKCDYGKSQRFELGEFLAGREKEGSVAILLGDLNASQLQIAQTLKNNSYAAYTPYKGTVSPELYSKAVDHIFIDKGTTSLQINPLAPNEIHSSLEPLAELLSH